MSPATIATLVEESLAGPRSVYVHHVTDPAAYLEAVRSRFIATRITPSARAVHIEQHVSFMLGLPEGDHVVYFVSEDEPQSVFFDPKTESFGCAWGPESETNRYVDLGVRSSDVLEMASA